MCLRYMAAADRGATALTEYSPVGPTLLVPQGLKAKGGMSPPGRSSMASFIQHYLDYRRVGIGRWAALRFAWVVVTTRSKPMQIR